MSFGDLCPRDTIYPLGLTQFYTLWPWGAFQGLYACYGFPECGLGAFDGLLSMALSSWILFFPGVPLCLLPKQQSTLLEFIFGLCLHDCLLSVRQDYLGELCWPFSWVIFSLEGFFLHRCFYLHMGYLTVPGSGLVPNLEEGCFFSKLTGCPSWLLPILALFCTQPLWLLLHF